MLAARVFCDSTNERFRQGRRNKTLGWESHLQNLSGRIVASKGRHLYSPNWALALLGVALLLIIVVGMIREVTERWRPDGAWTLDEG